MTLSSAFAECPPEQQKEAARAYQTASEFVQGQQWDQAIARMQSIVEFCPEYAPAWRSLGKAYLKSSQVEMAIKAYNRAIDVQGDQAEAPDHANLAKAYATKKDYASARAEYMKAQRLAPDDCGVLFNLGILHMASGYTIQAVETLEHAKGVCPQLEDRVVEQLVKACRKAGEQQRKIGNVEKAKEYEAMAVSYSGSAGGSTAYQTASQLMNQKKFNEAIPMFEEIVAATPTNANAHLSLARAYDAVGNKRSSAAAYEAYLKLNPDDERETASLIMVLSEAGRCTDAQAAAAKAKEKFAARGTKSLGKIYYAWGKALECGEDYEGAKGKFEQCLASGDTDWSGQARTQIGRMDQYLEYESKKRQKAAQGG